MWELISSLAFAACMVPVVMAIILGLIYGFGELCNFISRFGSGHSASNSHSK